jgi:DNA-binding transcriptional LysR family regulator
MTFTQLVYFLEVVRTGSLTSAAEALFVSQPTISEQIRRLEKTLGADLFVRVGRGVTLTDAGNAFLVHAARAVEEVKAAEASVTELTELQAGNLSIGVFGQAYSYGLADVIDKFHARYPGVTQTVLGQNSHEVANDVREGRLEAGIVFLPVDTTGLAVRPFFQDPILYVSADPERAKRPKTIEEFCKAPLILYDAAWSLTDPTRHHLNELAQRRGLTIRPVVDTEDVRVAIELARRGIGDTVVSRRMFENFKTQGLHGVEFAEPMTEDLALVYRLKTRLGPAARAFVDIFREHLTPTTDALAGVTSD